MADFRKFMATIVTDPPTLGNAYEVYADDEAGAARAASVLFVEEHGEAGAFDINVEEVTNA